MWFIGFKPKGDSAWMPLSAGLDVEDRLAAD
jgi:hypothetical protein